MRRAIARQPTVTPSRDAKISRRKEIAIKGGMTDKGSNDSTETKKVIMMTKGLAVMIAQKGTMLVLSPV